MAGAEDLANIISDNANKGMKVFGGILTVGKTAALHVRYARL